MKCCASTGQVPRNLNHHLLWRKHPRDDRETSAADTGAASTDAHAAETGIIADDNDVRSALKNGRIVGQLHQTYILLEVQGGGLWILDQHIVHERILYEQLVKRVY